MFNIGPPEMIAILVIALLVLGPKRLPEVGRSLGKGMREFKETISGAKDTLELEPAPTTVVDSASESGMIRPVSPEVFSAAQEARIKAEAATGRFEESEVDAFGNPTKPGNADS